MTTLPSIIQGDDHWIGPEWLGSPNGREWFPTGSSLQNRRPATTWLQGCQRRHSCTYVLLRGCLLSTCDMPGAIPGVKAQQHEPRWCLRVWLLHWKGNAMHQPRVHFSGLTIILSWFFFFWKSLCRGRSENREVALQCGKLTPVKDTHICKRVSLCIRMWRVTPNHERLYRWDRHRLCNKVNTCVCPSRSPVSCCCGFFSFSSRWYLKW